MFLLCDLHFLVCSLDLDVLRVQKIMGFFLLISHKSIRSENPITWTEIKARSRGKYPSVMTVFPAEKLHYKLTFINVTAFELYSHCLTI